LITADSTLWTADTHCVTADGRVVCIDAELHEAAASLDALDAVTDVAAAVAEAADISPKDNLDKVAPEIFKTQFKHPNMPYGPEPWLSNSRRSSKPAHLAYQY